MDTATIRTVLERHRFRVDNMAGDRNSDDRRAIMQAITGKKHPKAACGINAVQRALFDVSGVPGECLAARWDNLSAWAKAL